MVFGLLACLLLLLLLKFSSTLFFFYLQSQERRGGEAILHPERILRVFVPLSLFAVCRPCCLLIIKCVCASQLSATAEVAAAGARTFLIKYLPTLL